MREREILNMIGKGHLTCHFLLLAPTCFQHLLARPFRDLACGFFVLYVSIP